MPKQYSHMAINILVFIFGHPVNFIHRVIKHNVMLSRV